MKRFFAPFRFRAEAASGMDRKESRAWLVETFGDTIQPERRSEFLTAVFGPAFRQGSKNFVHPVELNVGSAPEPSPSPPCAREPARRLRAKPPHPREAAPTVAPAAAPTAPTTAAAPTAAPAAPPTPAAAAPASTPRATPILKRRCLQNPSQRAQRPPSVSPPPRRVTFRPEMVAKPPKPLGLYWHPDAERHRVPESSDETPPEVDGWEKWGAGGRLL